MVETLNASPILVVEDNEANIIVTTAFLELDGYHYDIARTGLEAVNLAREKSYAAILMDVKMPDISGLEATRFVREHEKISGNPRSYIIGLTAHATVQHRHDCLAAGMDDYLSKPIVRERLIEKISYAEKKKAGF